MKKIMILGAGVYQLPLIVCARRMGLDTIAVSRPGNYPGFEAANRHYFLDTTDEEAVLEAARAEKIDGIATAGTDVAVRTLGRVCRDLHLPGPSYDSTLNVTDKYRMKKAFAKAGVMAAKSYKAQSPQEVLQLFQKLQDDGARAVMVKAVDSSGSRGVTRVGTPQEALRAYEEARRVTSRPYVLVEEFIEGHEIGVDGFICDQKVALFLPHEKFVLAKGGVTIPSGHRFPYVCSEKLLENIRLQIERAIRAVGLDQCAFNCDVLIQGEDAYILEIGGRSGATGIPELISIYCGFSYYEKILENALGNTPDFTVRGQTPCTSRLLFSPTAGTITKIRTDILDTLKKDGVAVSLDFGIGDAVSEVQNGADRIGQFLLRSASPQELAEICRRVYSAVYVGRTPLSVLWKLDDPPTGSAEQSR